MANYQINFPQFPDPDWLRRMQDTMQQASKAIEASSLVNAAHYASAVNAIQESALASALKYSELIKTIQATATIAAMVNTDRLNEVIRQYSNLVPLTLDLKLVGGSVTVAERVAGLSANVEFATVAPELKTLQPVLERYERGLSEAPDPNARALTLQSGLKIAVEAFLGVPFESKTPEQRLRLGIGFLLLLFAIYMYHSDDLNEARQDGELSEVRAAQKNDGKALAELAKAVRRLQMHTADSSKLPALVTTKEAVLRELPNGRALRVAKLRAGTQLRLIVSENRWAFVEAMPEGSSTPTRGWVYKRNVRFRGQEPARRPD